jgi:hypothetical protein
MARNTWAGGPPPDPREFEDELRYGESDHHYRDREFELMERLAEQASLDIGHPEVRALARQILRGPAPTVERLELGHLPGPDDERGALDEAA